MRIASGDGSEWFRRVFFPDICVTRTTPPSGNCGGTPESYHEPGLMKRGGIDYRASRNLVQIFFDQAAQYGDQPFLWARRDGTWHSSSWRQAADDVRRLAAGLVAL